MENTNVPAIFVCLEDINNKENININTNKSCQFCPCAIRNSYSLLSIRDSIIISISLYLVDARTQSIICYHQITCCCMVLPLNRIFIVRHLILCYVRVPVRTVFCLIQLCLNVMHLEIRKKIK